MSTQNIIQAPKYTRSEKSVDPYEIDIMVTYKCPACEWNHYLKPQQYLYKGFIVVCDCGNIFTPNIPNLHKAATISNNVIEDTGTSNNLEDAIYLLESQGFDKNNLRKIAKKQQLSGNIDEIVTELLSHI